MAGLTDTVFGQQPTTVINQTAPTRPAGFGFAKSLFDYLGSLSGSPYPSYSGQIDGGLSPTMQDAIRRSQGYAASSPSELLQGTSGILGRFMNPSFASPVNRIFGNAPGYYGINGDQKIYGGRPAGDYQFQSGNPYAQPFGGAQAPPGFTSDSWGQPPQGGGGGGPQRIPGTGPWPAGGGGGGNWTDGHGWQSSVPSQQQGQGGIGQFLQMLMQQMQPQGGAPPGWQPQSTPGSQTVVNNPIGTMQNQSMPSMQNQAPVSQPQTVNRPPLPPQLQAAMDQGRIGYDQAYSRAVANRPGYAAQYGGAYQPAPPQIPGSSTAPMQPPGPWGIPTGDQPGSGPIWGGYPPARPQPGLQSTSMPSGAPPSGGFPTPGGGVKGANPGAGFGNAPGYFAGSQPGAKKAWSMGETSNYGMTRNGASGKEILVGGGGGNSSQWVPFNPLYHSDIEKMWGRYGSDWSSGSGAGVGGHSGDHAAWQRQFLGREPTLEERMDSYYGITDPHKPTVPGTPVR